MFSGEDNNSGVQEEALITLQKQYEIMEEGSIEQHVVLRKGTREDAQSRFSAFSEWRTVADKHADSSTHPRSRKREKTELPSSRRWTTWLKTEALKYKIMEEDSNRQPPVLQKDYMDDANKHARGRRLKRRIQVRVTSPHSDGFCWRKFGQKKILRSSYPRLYYRCLYHREKGCQATKEVQQLISDPQFFDVVYNGEHTCTESVHSGAEIIPPAMSESPVTFEAVSSSSSTAETCFRSATMPAGSQVTHEGVSTNTAGVRFMSPGASETSESQVTYEEVSGSTAGIWSLSDEVGWTPISPKDSMLDPNADFVDYTDYSDYANTVSPAHGQS